MFAKRRRRTLPALLVAAVIAGAITGAILLRNGGGSDVTLVRPVPSCDIPYDVLQRVWRGYVPGRSGDVLAIEQQPHQWGTRHSTPYPYTQDIPLVLYGPGFIRKRVVSDRPVTLADIAPTFADLLHFDAFPARDGSALHEALLPDDRRNGIPKLIVTLVWDGGGDNVLQRWPDEWPNLSKLMARGTSFAGATVGSSPSITPATHATLGTGSFPDVHGIPDVRMRVRGRMVDAFQGTSPRYLRTKTLGDLWDAANANLPKVGLLARDSWHLGMMGHGAAIPGGDKDIAVLDDLGRLGFHTNDAYYTLPGYITSMRRLPSLVHRVDARDGKADQRWLGNPIVPYDGRARYTPAWDIFETEKIVELLRTEGFGADDVADLFFTNYKSVDLAGHEWGLSQPEVKENLREQDAQIPVLIHALDRLVGRDNYVLAMTADHGVQPLPADTGGWSIESRDMTADIEKRFDKVTPNVPLLVSNRGYQYVLNHNELRRNDVTPADIAAYIRDYRIKDNITSTNTVLPRFEGHTDQRLFLGAFTPGQLKRAVECARRQAASGS